MRQEADVRDIVTLDIERPVPGGRMLARLDGRVVLVAGAIPGERVKARVERTARGTAFATVVDVIDASPDRRQPSCDPACGGLDYAHITVGRQRTLKAAIIADAFRRVGKIAIESAIAVEPSPEEAYRLRGRLHVRHGRPGFFLEGTSRLCDAAMTRQFAEGAVPSVARLLEAIGPAAGALEGIVVAENVAGTVRLVHLEPLEGVSVDAGAVPARLVDGIDGVSCEAAGAVVSVAGRTVLTDTVEDLCGSTPRGMTGAQWTRRAASFFQGNRHLVGTLLSRVVELVEGRRVLDLYAGVGLFSVGLAATGTAVVAVEGNATSAADLAVNAQPFSNVLTAQHASVEAALGDAEAGAFDCIVLDPPRTGMSPEAIAGVTAAQAPRIVYVSCDAPTLARDAAAFVRSGYELRSIEAFDMFPNTSHVESLAVFTSSQAPRNP
jgi:23S rRNA (uracil1939-C5)-methyltransferase